MITIFGNRGTALAYLLARSRVHDHHVPDRRGLTQLSSVAADAGLTRLLVVSLGAGMISNLLFLAAFRFRFERFLEPTLILGSGTTSAELLRSAVGFALAGGAGAAILVIVTPMLMYAYTEATAAGRP